MEIYWHFVWRATAVVVMVVAMATWPVRGVGTTPVLFARGSHYEVGYEMGHSVRHLIQRALRVNPAVETLVAFNRTQEGRSLYTRLLAATNKTYPQYVHELQGVAAGADISFGMSFLLTIQPEIETIQAAAGRKDDKGDVPPSGGCSDFMICNKEWALHVHSEDAPPAIRYLGAIWVTEIVDDFNRISESFIAFVYPGLLAGSAWQYNSHGLMTSGNILFPKVLPPEDAVPRRIVTRALMVASSIDDLLTKLRHAPPIGSGFNIQMSERFCSEPHPVCVRMAGVEMVTDGDQSNTFRLHEVTTFDFHFNEYQHLLAHVPHYRDHSSRWRKRRLAQYEDYEINGPLTSMDHIKFIMSDQHNRKYPFFRDGAPPDYLATASISIADYYNQKLHIYKDKPINTEPEMTFHLRPWHGRPLNLEDIILKQEPKSEPEIKQEPESEPEIKQEPESEPEIKQEPESEPEIKQKPESEPEIKQEPESEPEIKQEPESEPEIKQQLESEPEIKQKPESEPEIKQKPESEPEIKPNPVHSKRTDL